eukprot:1141198-Pelagomonas_calceolata.AAC.2
MSCSCSPDRTGLVTGTFLLQLSCPLRQLQLHNLFLSFHLRRQHEIATTARWEKRKILSFLHVAEHVTYSFLTNSAIFIAMQKRKSSHPALKPAIKSDLVGSRACRLDVNLQTPKYTSALPLLGPSCQSCRSLPTPSIPCSPLQRRVSAAATVAAQDKLPAPPSRCCWLWWLWWWCSQCCSGLAVASRCRQKWQHESGQAKPSGV